MPSRIASLLSYSSISYVLIFTWNFPPLVYFIYFSRRRMFHMYIDSVWCWWWSIFAKEEKVYIIIESLFFLLFGNLWWNNRSKESGTFIYLDWRHPWIHELIRCIVRSIRYGPSRDAPWLNPSWWLWCTSWSCKSIYKIGFEIRERIYFLFYTRIVRVTCNLDGCKSPRRKPGKSKIDLQGRRLYFRPRIPVAWR